MQRPREALKRSESVRLPGDSSFATSDAAGGSMTDAKAKKRINALDLSAVSRERLETMRAAGDEIQECYRVLGKAGLNVVGEVLRGQGTFYESEHYPGDDVFDTQTHAQYYYHAHRGPIAEHGHFHTFLRVRGMPSGVKPADNAGDEPWPRGSDALSHLIAISMDKAGFPIALFTVNRWVTGDTWYAAQDVGRMLERFVIDHAFPSWPVNRWITAMFRLFRPQMEWLLKERDAAIIAWAQRHRTRDVFEDRRLDVTSSLPISVEVQRAAVNEAIAIKSLKGHSSHAW